ncbi:MAG: DNA polymerase I [Synergistaceae bacterium]|nr:DNA polymerase I [Synergistaceae bacterium]
MINIKTFLIVDGHSLAHRGFHALAVRLTAPDGTPTAMIVGFMNMLFKVQDELLPDCTIVVFDASSKQSGHRAFRYDLQKDYKAYRSPTPDDLRVQMPILQNLLEFMGYRVIVREKVEADDVVASLVRIVKKQGHEAVVLSSDKDLLQILDEGVRMMRPVKNGISGAELYDVNAFVNEFGFPPSSMPDYLALIGDNVDNIKGVKGIGTVGAKKILAAFPTIEDIYAAIDQLPKSTRTKLETAGYERVIWTRDYMTRLKDDIYDDEPEFLDECVKFKGDFHKAEELAARLGLERILKRMGSSRHVVPRILGGLGESVMPDAEILTDDYKSALKNNPAMFTQNCRVWDLRTAYYLLHPDESGMKFPDVLAFLKQSANPPKTLAEIAGGLEAEIEHHEGLKDVMNRIDLPLIPVLNKMEEHGVRLSHGQFEAVRLKLEEKIAELERRLIQETGVRINMNSSQQVGWLLFEHMNFEPLTRTRGGANSTDNTVLERLGKLQKGTVPRILLEYRELFKMLSGFVIPLTKAARDDGVIHTTFEPAATGTGRLSSRDPNLQNIPAFGQWAESIKRGLIPIENGNIFVAADYSQIELRVLAHLSGEERLLEAFRKGRDIHTETASWVFGAMPELVTPELRRTAKMINFGLLYGMTDFGLAERIDVSRSEAREIMKRYFAALPGLRGFLEELVSGAKKRGYARTLAGRIRPVSGIPARNQALDRALINTPIQGTAADIARRAMIEFERAVKGKLFLQVHDSLVCECPEGEADEISQALREIMISAGGEIEHLEVEVKRGKTLADV